MKIIDLMFVIFLFSCTSNTNHDSRIAESSKEVTHIHTEDYCVSCSDLSRALLVPDSVRYLYVSQLDDIGLDSLIELKNLEALYIFDSDKLDLSKCLMALSKLRNLKTLSFNRCNIHELPGEIGLMKNLNKLVLEDTLTKVSPAIYELTKLQSLRIVSTEALFDIGKFKNIENLSIFYSKGQLLDSRITELKKLSHLSIGGRIKYLPYAMRIMKNLRELDITSAVLAQEEILYFKNHKKFNQLQIIKNRLPNCKIVSNGNFW